MTRIVDTSVILKWLVPEEGTDAAIALIGNDIAAPDLLAAELGNALWKKARRGEMSKEQALAGYAEVLPILVLLPTTKIRQAALGIALELKHAIYDCFFLALADALDTVLVTADRKLVERCRDTPFEGRAIMLTA